MPTSTSNNALRAIAPLSHRASEIEPDWGQFKPSILEAPRKLPAQTRCAKSCPSTKARANYRQPTTNSHPSGINKSHAAMQAASAKLKQPCKRQRPNTRSHASGIGKAHAAIQAAPANHTCSHAAAPAIGNHTQPSKRHRPIARNHASDIGQSHAVNKRHRPNTRGHASDIGQTYVAVQTAPTNHTLASKA